MDLSKLTAEEITQRVIEQLVLSANRAAYDKNILASFVENEKSYVAGLSDYESGYSKRAQQYIAERTEEARELRRSGRGSAGWGMSHSTIEIDVACI